MADSRFDARRRQNAKRRYVCQNCPDLLSFTTEKVVCPTCSARTVEILDVDDLERICNDLDPTTDPVPVPDVPRILARPVRRRVSNLWSNPVPDPEIEAVSVPENQEEVVCPKCMFRMLGFKNNQYSHVHPPSPDASPDISHLIDSEEPDYEEHTEENLARFITDPPPPTVTGVDVYFRQDDDASSIIIGFSRGHIVDGSKKRKLGMSEYQIDQVPEVTISNELLAIAQQCPICVEDFVIGENGLKLFCNHVFHKNCLLPWLKKRNLCPVCRCNQSHLAERSALDSSRNSLMSMVDEFIENFDGPVNMARREIKVPLRRLVGGRPTSDAERSPGSSNAPSYTSLTTSDDGSSTVTSDDGNTDEEASDTESE